MPKYNLKRLSTGEEWEVTCSYDEVTEMCKDDDIVKLLSTPNFTSDGGRGTLSRAGSEWRDHLGRIKKNSGAGNTIKV